MKTWKRLISIGLVCAMTAGPMTAMAEEPVTEAAEENAQESILEGQLTLDDLSALNGGAEKVYTHNGCVTLVDGTCSDEPVTSMKEAFAVVSSMMSLIGADAGTKFAPWREIKDPVGNNYYIFQQVYRDTTVCGGAVKVITDKDGNMIALTSSVESRMPDVEQGERISADEAGQIVIDREYETSGLTLEVLDQHTGLVILPSVLKIDMESDDASCRLAWVVYTNNPSGNVQTGSDLPYLAHYVSMTGEYLYNMPAITPDDEAGKTGYDSSYVFEFMEPAEYTGYVDLSDGSEKEISVTVMRDRRTGMYYLGNIERKIVVGQCYDFLYNDGQIVLESSPDNLEWDQVGLLSLYNYCRAYDYYREIGWTGGDGKGTPILILNNYCDDHRNGVNNACYIGEIYGMQCFAASCINDFSQCLDVIAHEFTHCVTHSVMTYNSYMNDYGAINEGMSDVQGKNCEMMAGDSDITNWIIGNASSKPVRSMDDPHEFQQPEFSWDLYYVPNVKNPSKSNDHGGVHFNSSLLNRISCHLVSEGGMTLDEARTFWFMVDCAMVPGTDYIQLSELLPCVLNAAGLEQYADTLADAIEKTRLGEHDMPETIDEDRAVVTLSLPDTEAFDTGNWMMMLVSVKVNKMIDRAKTIISQLKDGDFSALPEFIQLAVEEGREAAEEQEKAGEDKAGTLASSLLDVLSVISEEEKEPQTEAPPASNEELTKILEQLSGWIKNQFGESVFSSYGFAGQDGSTLTMVVKPGRTVPILQHQKFSNSSSEPDEVVLAVYIKGRWYSVNMNVLLGMEERGEKFKFEDLPDELVTDVFGENYENLANIRNLDDALDLFTIDIKGGEVMELSADGLDQVVIPAPTPPEEKAYGTLKPGRKSRPKLDTETGAEPVTETEAVTETEVPDEAA